MNASSSQPATSPSESQTTDGELTGLLRHLTLAVRDIQYAVNRINDTLDRDANVTDALNTLNEVLSFNVPALQDGSAGPSGIVNNAPVIVNTASAVSQEEPQKWYAVIVGREPGVFSGSAQINANVERIPDNRVDRYTSEPQARQAFDAALDAGEVEKVTLVIDRTVMSRADFEAGN